MTSPEPSAWEVASVTQGGCARSSVWDNIGDARTVEEMRKEDNHTNVTRTPLYTLSDAREIVARELEAEAVRLRNHAPRQAMGVVRTAAFVRRAPTKEGA